MIVEKEDMSLDGIAYEITVRDEVMGYFGAWFCKSCWRGGVKYELLPHITQAIEEAKGRANAHHSQIHQTIRQDAPTGGAMRPFDIES
jgi:hypothetical protein